MRQRPISQPKRPEILLHFLVYQAGFIVLLPLLALFFLLGLLFSPRLRRFWPHRLGIIPGLSRVSGTTLIHASSLGELNGLEPFLDLLDRRREAYSLSLYTDTGLLRARSRHASAFSFILPIDAGPFLTGIFLSPPRRVIVAETELWPGLLFLCRLRKVPVYLVNGRISEKNLRSLRWIRPFVRNLLRCFSGIYVQDRFSLKAIKELCPGVRPILVGSTKTELGRIVARSTDQIPRKRFGLGRGPVLLGGSLRGTEHLILAKAWSEIRKTRPDLQLVLVPRHLKSADEWEISLASAGMKGIVRLSALRSSSEIPAGTILVADKMGVLNQLYVCSDIVFVGGTITPVGGHNPIEPAVRSNVVLHGPSIANNRPGFEILDEAGAAFLVRNTREIILTLGRILSSAGQMARMKRKALDAFRKAPRTAELLYKDIFGGRL
jgi:3-deoxy-D-manno-octulosonic-acid transferase